MVDIPGNEFVLRELRALHTSGRGIAFVGAGASAGLYPLWEGLIRQLSDQAVERGLATDADRQFWLHMADRQPQQVVRGIRERLGAGIFSRILQDLFASRTGLDGKRYTPIHSALMCLNFRGYVSTNYDPGLLEARAEIRRDRGSTEYGTWKDPAFLLQWQTGELFERSSCPVLFAHGIYNRADTVVLGANEYREVYRSGPFRQLFGHLWVAERLVFVGFGFSDMWFTFLADEKLTQAAAMAVDAPRHIAVLGFRDDDDVEQIRRLFQDQYHALVCFYHITREPDGRQNHSGLFRLLESLASPALAPTAEASPVRSVSALAYVTEGVVSSVGAPTPSDDHAAVAERTYRMEDQPWYTPDAPDTRGIEEAEIGALAAHIDVVLMTATDVELRAVLGLLESYPRRRQILKVYSGPETYYVGKFAKFRAVVTKCRMGSIGEGAVILATEQAQRLWRPRAVIMAGIAFGRDPATQHLGDVLVASQVISYEQQRVGQQQQIVFRGSIPPSNAILLNRFENAQAWHFKRPDGSRCGLHVGPVLSGEKLIDDPAFKAALLQLFPQAIGGEMEGAGLCAASGRVGTAWILVKAICDWADGKKHKEHQPLAAAAAAALVHYVLSQPTVLRAIPKGDASDTIRKTPRTNRNGKLVREHARIAGGKPGQPQTLELDQIIDPKGWLPGKPRTILPRVSDITDPYGPPVGVFASHIAAAFAPKDGYPPYIRRDIDPDIDTTLRDGKCLLIVGAPHAGKTRTIWEGAVRNLRDYRVLFPNRAYAMPLTTLASLKEPLLSAEDEKVILWLDDAYGFLAKDDLSYRTLTTLRDIYPRMVVLATIAIHELDGLRKPKGFAAGDPNAIVTLDLFTRVLSEFVELRLNDHLRQDGEAEARQLYPDLVDQPGFVQGLGRFFAASEERWARYVEAFDSQKVGAAVVTAAIDWSRTGMQRPVTESELCRLVAPYSARLEAKPLLATEFETALTWACSVSLLVKTPNDDTEDGEFRVTADMVRRSSDKGTPWDETIPAETWDFVLTALHPDDGISVARAAIKVGNWEAAFRAANCTANSQAKASVAGALLAGISQLMMHGPSEQVYTNLQRVTAAEDDNLRGAASLMLASLHLEAGNLDEVEQLLARYRNAADTQRQATARLLTAMMDWRRGQYDRAKAYIQSVLTTELDEHNAVLAALLLIQLAERSTGADLTKVESLITPLLRSSKDASYHGAHFVAGLIALKRGDLTSAREYWKTVRDSGPPILVSRTSLMLGMVAVTVGEFQEGESLLQPLLSSTDGFVVAYASFGMGILLTVQGKFDAARTHFQAAIEQGQFTTRKQAQLQLAVLEATHGHTDAARALLQPYEGDEGTAASLAQAAALMGDLQRASHYLPPDQVGQLPIVEQLLMVQRGLLAADDPDRLDAAEWLLTPFIGSENLLLASLAGLGGGIIAIAQRQFTRAEELLGMVAEKAPSRLALRAKFQLGVASLQQGDWAETERRLTPLAEEPAVATNANFTLGMALLAGGQSERAQTYFRRTAAIAIDEPELHAVAHFQLAAIALRNNAIGEATALFTLGTASDSLAVKSEAEFGLSQVAEQRGDIDAARKHAEAAVALKPDNGLALARVALLASEQGDRRAALEAQSRLGTMARLFVHQLLAAMPPGAEQFANVPREFGEFLDLARRELSVAVRVVQSEGAVAKARLLRMDQRYDEAMVEIDRAVVLDPKNSQALFWRGQWHRLANHLNEALNDFNHLLEHHSELPIALAGRGQSYRALRNFEQAMADLNRAINLDPTLEWALVERAGLALERGELEKAAADVRLLAEHNNAIVDSLIAEARSAVGAGQESRAWELLTLGLMIEPNNPSVLAGRGSLLSAQGKDHEALSDFATALALAPDDVPTLGARGEHYLQRWQLEAAFADFDRAMVLEPHNAVVNAYCGITLGMLGKHDDAITYLSEALRLDPQQAWVFTARGAQYRSAGRLVESAADLDHAIALRSEDDTILSQRAETAIAAGDYALAVDLLTRAIDRNPENAAWTYYARGRAQHATGLTSTAIEDFQEAIRRTGTVTPPVNPMEAFNHALFRLAVGQETEAIARYKILIHQAPTTLLREVLVDLDALKKSGPWETVTGAEVVKLIQAKLQESLSNEV